MNSSPQQGNPHTPSPLADACRDGRRRLATGLEIRVNPARTDAERPEEDLHDGEKPLQQKFLDSYKAEGQSIRRSKVVAEITTGVAGRFEATRKLTEVGFARAEARRIVMEALRFAPQANTTVRVATPHTRSRTTSRTPRRRATSTTRDDGGDDGPGDPPSGRRWNPDLVHVRVYILREFDRLLTLSEQGGAR